MHQDLRTGEEILDLPRGHEGSHRFRTRAIIVGIVMLLAGGLIVEQVGAAPGARQRPANKWSSFQPNLAPRPVPAPPAPSGSGTAGLIPAPTSFGDSRNICAELLEDGAQRLAQVDARIALATNPVEIARLQQTRTQIKNDFNRLLAQRNCPISFG